VEDGDVFSPAQAQGKGLSNYQAVTPGQGLAGAAIESGEVHLPEGELDSIGDGQALACIPLQVAGRVIGLFEVRSFLPQKESLSELDAELVRLVSFHAGMALFASALAANVDHQGLDVASILRAEKIFVEDR
jgi:GAF domain-containing protein